MLHGKSVIHANIGKNHPNTCLRASSWLAEEAEGEVDEDGEDEAEDEH